MRTHLLGNLNPSILAENHMISLLLYVTCFVKANGPFKTRQRGNNVLVCIRMQSKSESRNQPEKHDDGLLKNVFETLGTEVGYCPLHLTVET